MHMLTTISIYYIQLWHFRQFYLFRGERPPVSVCQCAHKMDWVVIVYTVTVYNKNRAEKGDIDTVNQKDELVGVFGRMKKGRGRYVVMMAR